jgi:hypothetical protein
MRTLTALALQLVSVRLRSANNERHFPWRRDNHFGFISPSIRGFLFSETTQLSLYGHAVQLVYVWLQSVEEHFSWGTMKRFGLSRLIIGGIFSKLHTYHFIRMLYNWYKFGWDRSITKGTYLENKESSRLYVVFYSWDFFEIAHLSLAAHAL